MKININSNISEISSRFFRNFPNARGFSGQMTGETQKKATTMSMDELEESPTYIQGQDVSRDCALVIDASQSMLSKDWRPSRLGAAQEAAVAFIKRLSAEESASCVAVIAYGSTAQLHCRLTSVKNKQLKDIVKNICCLGRTNIKSGLDIALQVLSGCKRQCQVVLLSDGHNNEQQPIPVAEDLKKFAIIECVGIGGRPQDVDERLLRNIASAYPDGKKRYRWIGDKERLVRHFHNLAGRIARA